MRRSFAALAGLVLLAATACSSGGDDADVEVMLQDTQITLSTETVPAGETTFATQNQGSETHEFEIFRTDLAPGELPVDGDTADTADLQLMDEVEDVAPSTTAQLTTGLEPGSYVLICNLPEHYARGMHVSLTVE
jgi:uncharacterized cupredoxin-like copper-binding protein